MFAVDTFFLMRFAFYLFLLIYLYKVKKDPFKSALVLTISFLNKWEKSPLKIKEWIYFYVHRYWRLIPPYLIIIVIYVQGKIFKIINKINKKKLIIMYSKKSNA
jgi:hypothetical protein